MPVTSAIRYDIIHSYFIFRGGLCVRARYTGCFSNTSGIIHICDPRATQIAGEYYGIDATVLKTYNQLYEAPRGLYKVFSNLYIENSFIHDEMLPESFSSHIIAIPDSYNGESLTLVNETIINIGLSSVICIVDDDGYDNNDYCPYGLLNDAVYNVHDILNNGTYSFIHSNMEPLETLKDEYITGETLLRMCNGIPDLACSGIRSTHWSEDTIYRAQLMEDIGNVIYNGAACLTSSCESAISVYSFDDGFIFLCSLLNLENDTCNLKFEHELRDKFIEQILKMYIK